VLLFGIGTKALPGWDSKTRWNNLMGGLAVKAGSSRHTISPHPSFREGHRVRSGKPRLAYSNKSAKGKPAKLRSKPLSRSPRRRACPRKIGPIGIATAGLHAQETGAEPAQLLRVGLVLVASACESSGLPATGHRCEEKSGLIVGPGPVRVLPVWSGSSRANGAAGFTAASQPALGPRREERGSRQLSAGDGPKCEVQARIGR
jgi:hypothetical protein